MVKANCRKKDDDEEDEKIRTIKLALNSILLPHARQWFLQNAHERSFIITKISCLASLLLLFKVNTAFDDDDREFFTDQTGIDAISGCFRAVATTLNRRRTEFKFENEHQMPPIFRAMVERHCGENFQWPCRTNLGQSFNYFYQQYTTNVETNLKTHCQSRLTYFLRMKCYQLNRNGQHQFDNIDIRNAIKDVMTNEDWIQPGDELRLAKKNRLLDELVEIGFPRDVCIKTFVKYNWFRSIWMFIRIQREVEEFLVEMAHNREQWNAYNRDRRNIPEPTVQRPPAVHNFTVIPLCRFKLKKICYDKHDVYDLASSAKMLPRFKNPETNRYNNQSKEYYKQHQEELWGLIFDMAKIRRINGNKNLFHSMILTDSVSVSVLYDKPNNNNGQIDESKKDEKLRAEYNDGHFEFETGIDPNDNTYLAVVRRHIESGVEENIKISSTQFHWNTKYGVRAAKAERLTKDYTEQEQNHLKSFPVIPSPRGVRWRSYVQHRLKMLDDGMEAYARRTYARLDLDHYIQSNRASDKIAVELTKNQPSLIYFGGASLAPNRPFGLKKRKRCPGTRKFVVSVKKLGHSRIKFVDEYFTSQTCANCFKRFPQNTKRDRFKVCKECNPPASMQNRGRNKLPEEIITRIGKRTMKVYRRLARNFPDIFPERRPPRNQRNVGNAAQPNVQIQQRYVPSIIVYSKEWPRNDAVYEKLPSVVWHRDIVAAKCIMYKGRCSLFNEPIHPSLMRPPSQPIRMLRNANNANNAINAN